MMLIVSETWCVNHSQPRFQWTLIDGEYKMQQFDGDRPIISPAFPGLTLTTAEILQAGENKAKN